MVDDYDALNFSQCADAIICVVCKKCRLAAFYEGVEAPIPSLLLHAEQCGSSDMVLIEILPPIGTETRTP